MTSANEELVAALVAAAVDAVDGFCDLDLLKIRQREAMEENLAESIRAVLAQAKTLEQAKEELRNAMHVERQSDQSVTITFVSCRATSAFERSVRAASAKEAK